MINKFMKKILCFDLDGVICTTTKGQYNKSKPKKENIKFINEMYDEGHVVKVFTARYMTRCNGNIKLVKKNGYDQAKKQLKRWKLKYHKLIMGKPSYDLFVDDKAFGFKKNWVKELRMMKKK